MSKPYYETEEYNEAENELDTYDDPVKLVMEYRISEKHKDNKIADLEAKLAEKEELKLRIKKLNKLYSEALETVDSLFTNQDKISFTIQQLEKVKETLMQNADEIGEEYKEDYFMISLGNIKNIIDNQIKQLKEMK